MNSCLGGLGEFALRGAKPQIFTPNQGGAQFTRCFVAKAQTEEIKISWSGRGRCYDNILVERL